jgi:hypothetical protein
MPVVIGKVILCRVLEGDTSPSSSRTLGSRVIDTPARATALVTLGGTAPPPPHGVDRLKNPPPSELLVNVLGYVSGYFLGGFVVTDELLCGKPYYSC